MSFQNCSIKGVSVNPDTYHLERGKRGAPDFIVSSGSLRSFEACPERWQAGYESPDSTAKLWGSLLDTLLLTPDQFSERYAVKPLTYPDSKTGEPKPWNGNSTWCKAWLEENAGVVVISDEQQRNADIAVARLMADPTIAAFVAASDKQVWVQGEWLDAETKLVIPVRCLIDLVPRADTEFARCVADLKTTRNAALGPWTRWCWQAGYHIQAAWNLDMLASATKEDRTDFCFILQENYEPWQTGKRLLSQDFLSLGREEYHRMIGNYAQCLKLGRWPGYDDTDEACQGWGLVVPSAWMQGEGQFAPKMQFAEPEPEPENFDVPMP